MLDLLLLYQSRFMILQPGVQGIAPGSEMYAWNSVIPQDKDKKLVY